MFCEIYESEELHFERNCTFTRWAHSLLSKKLMKQNGLKNTFIQFSNNGIRLLKEEKKDKNSYKFCVPLE